MKSAKKLSKALIVIIIVGIGLLNNINKPSDVFYSLNPFYNEEYSLSEKRDSNKTNEIKLFDFTKKVILAGFKHLFPSL